MEDNTEALLNLEDELDKIYGDETLTMETPSHTVTLTYYSSEDE